MSVKDYILIASAMNIAYPCAMKGTVAYRAWQSCAEELAGALARDNDNFNYLKFIKSCHIGHTIEGE